ncbi:uncharacterized protein LY89DRAFT_677066 [Mollisia scopiformis]|uniref:Uncharacterized protein n=1 Tax=Mollisia scopiformis TaxID=149040 RepID=A0A132B6Z0_MOLSC|nr:uncharacterized protein LY89DRAFT_677066 [Mollisia scopiformis]KUJ08176.1 hypothetical protein LY89DRAFT_677066 [Mollisia scopiformis]
MPPEGCAGDQPLHKLFCDEVEEFLASNPQPQDSYQTTYKLGLVLHEMNTSAEVELELTWVRTELDIDHDTGYWSLLRNVSGWLKSAEAAIHARHDRKIEIWSSTDKENLASNDNVRLLASNGMKFNMQDEADGGNFEGPIVVMAVSKYSDRVSEYRDFAAADLRILLSCFLQDTFFYEIDDETDFTTTSKYILFDQPEWIQGVAIWNSGTPNMFHVNLQLVMINRNHPKVERYDHKSAISEHMDIPLLFLEYPKKPGDLRDYTNKTAYREDGQAVTLQQIEALSAYCQFVLSRALEPPEDWTWEPEDKKAVLDVWCSAEKFGKYFEIFKKGKLAEDNEASAEWADALPPPGMRSAGIVVEENLESPLPKERDDDTPEQRRRRVLKYAESRAKVAMSDPDIL